jgi:hypothetical protein
VKRYSLILTMLLCFPQAALADDSLSDGSISNIFGCFEHLRDANFSNFPGNALTNDFKVLTFSQDPDAKNPGKIMFVSSTTVSCADVPTNQGDNPGDTLLQINPRDFGDDGTTFLWK